MDRAAEFPLQGRALWSARHSYRRKSQGNLFSCLLAFCLLAVFMLSLPVVYLLSRHLREPQACKVEERAVGMPEFQKQTGMPAATEMKPRAHLTELDTDKLKCVPREFPTLQWKYNHPDTAKIKYENGFLVISKSGDYFVYAQVTFRNQSTEKDNCGMETKEVTHVTQIISKLDSGYPIPVELLRGSHSIIKTQNWNYAIYLGAVVHLQENDKLFVNVSNTKLVYAKREVTFFGAFLI